MSKSEVLWSPRAHERLRGLELDERKHAKTAVSGFRKSGASTIDGPALSQDEALRWRLFGRKLTTSKPIVTGVLEYRVFEPGETSQLLQGGYFVTLVITETGAVNRIRRHLRENAK